MLASIIIPTKNESKILHQTLMQFDGYRDIFEIIVSDGGSSDGTLDIARALADHLVEAPKDTQQNIAIGRNAGAKKATCHLFIFLDADVTISCMETFCQTIEAFLKSASASYMTLPVCVHPDTSTRFDHLFHVGLNVHVQLCHRYGHSWARWECQIFQRDLFEALGGYDESLIASEDYDICLRAMKIGSMHYAKTPIIYETGRRYKQYGYPKTVYLWMRNAWSMRRKWIAYSQEWEVVR